MTDLERKVERYRKGIPRKEVSEAFKVFKLTGDEDIRDNLILRFMPIAIEHVKKLGVEGVEEDDLAQMAYEKLIHCVDSYNPYTSVLFSQYLWITLRRKFGKIEESTECLSLSNTTIISNDNMEERVIHDVTLEDIMRKIREKLPSLNESDRMVFEKLMSLDDISLPSIGDSLNISKQRVAQIKKRLLWRLYYHLKKEYPYMPSEEVTSSSFTALDYFSFYYNCDSIDYGHPVLERWRKN